MILSRSMTPLPAPTGTRRTVAGKSAFYLAHTALAFFVTGCSVGPKYKQPVIKLQPYHSAPAIDARTSAPPAPTLDTWWKGFNDPALTRIVERALAQNLDLAASFARVQQARAAAQEAGANRMPNFVVAGDDTASRQSLDSPTGRIA